MPPAVWCEPVEWDPNDTSRDPSLPEIIQALPFDASRRIYFPNPHISEMWDHPGRLLEIDKWLDEYDDIETETRFRNCIEEFMRLHYSRVTDYAYTCYGYDIKLKGEVELSKDFNARKASGAANWDKLQAVQELREEDERRKALQQQEQPREPPGISEDGTVSCSSRTPLTRSRVTKSPDKNNRGSRRVKWKKQL